MRNIFRFARIVRPFVFLLILLSISFTSSGREKESVELLKGNFYYSMQSFGEAIPWFEKSLAKLPDAVVYTQLAQCYSMVGEDEKAIKAFDNALSLPNCDNEVRMKYAQLLMQLTRYEQAEKMLQQYKVKARHQKRADNMIAGCRKGKEISNNLPEGIVSFLPFNTDCSEFAPTVWNGNLVFAADTSIGNSINLSSDRYNKRFDLFFLPINNATTGGDTWQKLSTVTRVHKHYQGPCTATADGRNMYLTVSLGEERKKIAIDASRNYRFVELGIMIASDYDSLKKVFRRARPFEYNSKDYSVVHPAISPNGELLAFSSNMPRGQGGSDIYICRKTKDGHWSRPQNAGSTINTDGEEVFPSWLNNETLCFSSDGHDGLGGLDVFRAVRNAKTNSFAQPVNLEYPLNSSYDDVSLAINDLLNGVWLSSNRPASKAGDNIYYYRHSRAYIAVNVVEAGNAVPLQGAAITIQSDHQKADAYTSEGGAYLSRIWPGEKYTITAAKEGFRPQTRTVLSAGKLAADTILINIALERNKIAIDTVSRFTQQPVVVRNKNVMDSPGIRNFEVGATYEVGDFTYDYNTYKLTAAHQPFLDTLLAQLKRNPSLQIEIQAHTDCRGSAEFNKYLSDKRAQQVVNYLVGHGVTKNRVPWVGIGSSKPKIKCEKCELCTEQQHSVNRLLEFKVLHE